MRRDFEVVASFRLLVSGCWLQLAIGSLQSTKLITHSPLLNSLLNHQMKLPVILIFDVGKTNKKVLLFDEQYKLLRKKVFQLEEITDEDGFPCEDVNALTKWVTAKVF